MSFQTLRFMNMPTKHQKPKQTDHNLTFSFVGKAGICGRDFAEHVHQPYLHTPLAI